MSLEKIKQRVDKVLEQESLKDYGYKFVGMGSDKAVFETTGSSKKVVKINKNILKQKILDLLTIDYFSSGYVDKNHDLQQGQIDEIKEGEKEIREIFGEEHFLKTGVFKAKILITKELLIALIGNNYNKKFIEKLPEDFKEEIEMLAETQLVAEELKDPEKFSLIDFRADSIIDKDFYGQENIDNALEKVRSIVDEGFVSNFENILKDEKYKKVIKEIFLKIIEYTKKTGLMIDIFGKNNITIYKKENGEIDYHVIEALLPGFKKHWSGDISEDPNLELLKHCYSYYYFIKNNADKIGVENNLKPEDLIYFKKSGIPVGDWPVKI